jgi:DNA-binding response OmpR family regulator
MQTLRGNKMSVKVLLVDDDLTLLDCISQGLTIKKFSVVKATNGKDALLLAQSEKPDVILLDIILPDLGGGEVAAQLEKNEDTAHIPIIFLTGLLTHDEAHTVISGRSFIGKPYTINDIEKEIKLQLGNKYV